MLNKIVLTGASGRLGSYLRKPLSKLCMKLISTDIKNEIGPLFDNEEFIQADLSKFSEIEKVIQGSTMVCHFGALVDEAPFEDLLGPNFVGSYNVWESAKINKVKRIIYASSIHAVGMYSKTETLTSKTLHNPDTFYGLGKCFSEDLAKMYYEKNGLESVCLRIASCAPVTTLRSLSTWLSYNDLIQMVTRCIDTPFTGFSIVYGVSNNTRKNVDNSQCSHIGFTPNDNAEQFADEIFKGDCDEELNDEGNKFHGGPFSSTQLGISPLSKMKINNKKKEN